MTNDEQMLNIREILSDPDHAAALVAWDRDIEPILSAHKSIWSCPPDMLHHYTELWVSLAPPGDRDSACCHYTFDPVDERWVLAGAEFHAPLACPLRSGQ